MNHINKTTTPRPPFRWGRICNIPETNALFYPEFPGLECAYIATVERQPSGRFLWQLSGYRYRFQAAPDRCWPYGLEPTRDFAMEAAEQAAAPFAKEFDDFILSPAGAAYLTAVAPKDKKP